MIEKSPKDLADMNAARSVRPLTAAAKVNWTLSRFRTPLYAAVHSHRFRTACRHGLRTGKYGGNCVLAVIWDIVETGRAPSHPVRPSAWPTHASSGQKYIPHSLNSVSKTQYFSNPLQANEVSAVWGLAASSLLLAAPVSCAPKYITCTPRK